MNEEIRFVKRVNNKSKRKVEKTLNVSSTKK